MKTSSNTVLVVDDAPDSLSLINDTLENANINTLVALDGKQALSIARQLKPDMILLDALMPNMDGFETCKHLKNDPDLKSIPIIFMTGLSDSESILKALEIGGVDYLTKPVNPDELLARMKVHLNNAKLTTSAHQALDSIGQNTFMVNLRGQIIWATPQTYGLFSKHNMSMQWLQESLASKLNNWLCHKPKPGQRLSIDYDSHKLDINVIEFKSDDEVLLKLTEPETISAEKKLQQALNITERESEVLLWLANGKTNKEIAEILSISVRTAHKHLEQIFPKLGVDNRTSAAAVALRVIN